MPRGAASLPGARRQARARDPARGARGQPRGRAVSEELLVLDSSVGVKWVKPEEGSDEALALLLSHAAGEVTLAVADVFVYEVLDVTRRTYGRPRAVALWERLADQGPLVVPTDPDSFPDILEMSRRLDCSLYDAAAPALAARYGGTLVSADARAHAGFPGVRLIG
ncbi:MAG: hypothetical protein C0418_03695 [Coriobacteriaceae bacterium]|nr:hypothetical protein [Coriobacteriaceae bacterium]